MKVKYIIVSSMGIEVPVVFSELLKHSEVAAGRHVISAGFVHFASEETSGSDRIVAACYGESTSLNISSRPEDSNIVTQHIFPEY